MWGWILAGIVALIAGIGFAQHRSQRGTYRPLASRQPQRPQRGETPLGMEATDLETVTRAARRNEALERAHTNWTRKDGSTFRFGSDAADTTIDPMPDDETYAKRFHAAYMKNKKEDT